MDVFNHSYRKLYIKTINDLDPGLNLPEIDSAGINLTLTINPNPNPNPNPRVKLGVRDSLRSLPE